MPKPVYPKGVHGVSGAVKVQVIIDEMGNVIQAQAVSGHTLLQAAAVEAARGSRFSPTILSGQPVKVSGVITYNFVAR
jgi:protein TonB